MHRFGVFGSVLLVLVCGCPGDAPADGGMDGGMDGGADAPAPDVRADVPLIEEPLFDAPPDVPPDAPACDGAGAAETCNGRDDDCDGTVDDGCACRPMAPVPVEDGFHVGVVVTSSGEIVTGRQDFTASAFAVQRRGADLRALGGAPNLIIDSARFPSDMQLFALGDDVGGVWRMARSTTEPADDVFFARVDRSTLLREVDPLNLTSPTEGSLGASATPFGSGFVLARGERISALDVGVGIRFVGRDGAVTSGPHFRVTPGTAGYTGVAATDDAIGVAYQADTGTGFAIHFTRFDATGAPVGSVLDTTGLGVRPHVAAQPSGWGVIFEGSDGEYFTAIAPDGTLAVAPRRISSGGSQGAAIAADGSGNWGVVFRGGVGTEFVLLDGTGAEIGRAELAGMFVDGLGSLAHDGGRFIAGVFGAGSALWVPCETR